MGATEKGSGIGAIPFSQLEAIPFKEGQDAIMWAVAESPWTTIDKLLKKDHPIQSRVRQVRDPLTYVYRKFARIEIHSRRGEEIDEISTYLHGDVEDVLKQTMAQRLDFINGFNPNAYVYGVFAYTRALAQRAFHQGGVVSNFSGDATQKVRQELCGLGYDEVKNEIYDERVREFNLRQRIDAELAILEAAGRSITEEDILQAVLKYAHFSLEDIMAESQEVFGERWRRLDEHHLQDLRSREGKFYDAIVRTKRRIIRHPRSFLLGVSDLFQIRLNEELRETLPPIL